MEKIALVLLLVSITQAVTFRSHSTGSRPYKDVWGHSYKRYSNLWKDSDKDGVINFYDYNDKNPKIQMPVKHR